MSVGLGFQNITFSRTICILLFIYKSNVCVMFTMEMQYFFIVNISYHIATGKQQILSLPGFYVTQVLVIAVNIAFLRMQKLFFLVHGQIIQAVLFAGQIPFLCGTYVIQHGTGMERQNQAHRINSGIDHITQRKIHQPEFSSKGFRGQWSLCV